MPKLGEKLPAPPNDVAELMTMGAPMDSTVPFDPAMESDFTGKARDGRATTVSHTHARRIPLYDHLGNDRVCDIEDLLIVTDPELESHNRLYVRCPLCATMPNQGLHEVSGPTGCPARGEVKFMVCPICASRGIQKRVYEETSVESKVAGEIDEPNYVAYDEKANLSKEDLLRHRLELHMATFHASTAEQRYGIRREPIAEGRSWRIVRSN